VCVNSGVFRRYRCANVPENGAGDPGPEKRVIVDSLGTCSGTLEVPIIGQFALITRAVTIQAEIELPIVRHERREGVDSR